MVENKVAKILRIIGIVEAVCGFIVGLYISAAGGDFGWAGIVVMLSSFITCMLFIGFGEIINLLQKNVDKQDTILSYLNEKPVEEESAPKTVLQDIESNLPNM